MTFSVRWEFKSSLQNISGLSLLISLCIVRVLNKLTKCKLCIKWPNDILHKNQKIAGILVECKTNPRHTISAIIGVGININFHPSKKETIKYDTTDLSEISGLYIDRNLLLAKLLLEFYESLLKFEKSGFQSFGDEWNSYHCFNNMRVVLQLPDNKTVEGVAKGVTDNGELILNNGTNQFYFSSGNISLKHI